MKCLELSRTNHSRVEILKSSKDAQSKDNCELHRCLGFWLRMCRWMGFFPVEGLDEPTISGIRCNFKGFFGVYHATVILMGTVSVIFNCLYLFEAGLSLFVTDLFIFHISSFYTLLILSRLSKQWPRFIKKATETEHHLQKIRTFKNTHKYCNIMALFLSIISLIDYLGWVLFELYVAAHCKTNSDQFSDILKEWMISLAPYYFEFGPYNVIVGIILLVVLTHNYLLRVIRNIFIIVFSIYLISYYKDLNKAVNNRLLLNNNLSWEQLRTNYFHLVELVKHVNKVLYIQVLMTYLSYLVTVCIQLHGLLKNYQDLPCSNSDQIRRSSVYVVHNFIALVYHLSTFIVTSLIAAEISLVARMPLVALSTVPSAEYGLVIQRFRSLVVHSQVAISGVFFSITRPMILQLVGSIVTYEVVMLQYG